MSFNEIPSEAFSLVGGSPGYGPLPIPIARDEELSTLIRQWMALDVFLGKRYQGQLMKISAKHGWLIANGWRLKQFAKQIEN